MLNRLEDARSQVNQWLAYLGQSEGASLLLNRENYCPLLLSGKHEAVIKLNAQADSISLISYIGEELCSNNLEVIKSLLISNFKDEHLYGGTVGLCEDTHRYTLRNNFLLNQLDEAKLLNSVKYFEQALNRVNEKILSNSFAKNPPDNTDPKESYPPEYSSPENHFNYLRG